MAETGNDLLDELYNKYNILVEAGDKITEKEDEYAFILTGVKGNSNEKRLSSQFIAKFFKHFPKFHVTAIDALLDLCEDEDTIIRKQAIRDLPIICKDSKEYVPKITDILAQLLVTDDVNEQAIINSSLMALCKLHPRGFLTGLFAQIEAGEETTREKVVKFLASKVSSLPEDISNKEDEEYFFEEARKVMQDCTKEEFLTFMQLLSSLKLCKTLSGQQALIDILTEQAELDNPFDSNDIEAIDKIVMCINQALPYFSPYINSNQYIQYICSQIIPVLDKATETAKDILPGFELQIYQIIAEISPFINPDSENTGLNLTQCLNTVFNKLLDYMPLPPVITEDNAEKEIEPKLELSHVESLMYAFHQLYKHEPNFLLQSENGTGDERIKEVKMRLQYLARGVQNYIKRLKESLSSVKKTEEMKSDENKLKYVALRTTSNINAMIKDLFKNPPSFKLTLNLSWKPVKKAVISAIPEKITLPSKVEGGDTTTTPASSVKKDENDTPKTENASKRKAITAPEGVTKPKKEVRQFYAPPGGKFSTNVSVNYNPARGGGRASYGYRGRPFTRGGGFRGRGQRGGGRGFRNYNY